MESLYIVRHGIAVPHGTPGYEDDQRPLTEKGERRVKQVARGLRRFEVRCERIATSPLPRARRTAEILARVFGLNESLENADALRADRDAESIRDWLDGRSERSLMIVGHNPAISEIISLLTCGQVVPGSCNLETGGVAALSGLSSDRYRLDWLAPPLLIRRYD